MDISKAVTEELRSGYQPGSSHWVNIIHIINPHNFFVRPPKYDSHLQHIESSIQSNEEIIDVRILLLVGFRSIMKGGKIIRGQIISITETELAKTCEIFAFDYGYIEKIPVKHIYKCDRIVFQMPPLALHCHLYMSLSVGSEWSENSIEAFKFYLGDEMVKIIIRHRIINKFIVDVINTCPDDMTSTLAMTGHCMLAYVDRFAKKDQSASSSLGSENKILNFNFRERELNDTLHVRMLYGKKLKEFYVAEVNEYKDLLLLRDDINLHATRERELNENEMFIGRPVLVYDEQNPKNCQRAVIESILSPAGTSSNEAHGKSDATVCFIDSGKRVIAQIENIKHIPQELMVHPGAAIYCSTQDIPSDVKLEDFLLHDYQFKITIEEVGSELKLPYKVKVSLI